jgi:hypothetical protein
MSVNGACYELPAIFFCDSMEFFLDSMAYMTWQVPLLYMWGDTSILAKIL